MPLPLIPLHSTAHLNTIRLSLLSFHHLLPLLHTLLVISKTMVFTLHSICTFLLLSFAFLNSHPVGGNAWSLRSNTEESSTDMVEEVSGEDNVGGEMVTKIRILLGLNPSGFKVLHQFSPAPTPAPLPPLTKHTHTQSRVPHKTHIAHQPVEGRRGRATATTVRRILIAVAMSVGMTIILLAATVAVLLVCKRLRRTRRKRSKFQITLNSTNKVSFDPGPGLFYLNPLSPVTEITNSSTLEQPSECKYVVSIPSESRSSSPLQSAELIKCEAYSVSCSNEEIQPVEPSSSDDKSYHSACNSHSSSVVNTRCSSANCSPISSHSPLSCHSLLGVSTLSKDSKILVPTEEISPAPSNLELSSIPIPTTKDSSKCLSNNATRITQTPSVLSNGNIPKPPPPPPSQLSGGSIMQPPPPPQTPSMLGSRSISQPPSPPQTPSKLSGGSIPRPPPPPSPPLKLVSPQKGCSSSEPPPPQPWPLQQSTPVGKDGATLPKLKPLHWDKVSAAPNRSMVWDKIRSSSFELDEETMESLFGYNIQSSVKNEEAMNKASSPSKHVLDHKRLQNVTILLKALNATAGKVSDALMQGGGLSVQQLEALVNMVLTKEEEEKLSKYEGDMRELDPSEKFIMAVLKIPFAFSRIEVMLYKETFEDEVIHLRKSFKMLEEACKELRSSQLFLRLLEAVLRTGNRMNVGTIRGGARAFKLDALLKLSDVKGTDGKTTLLHFVVQEMVRSVGARAMEKAMQTVERKNSSKTAVAEEKEEDVRLMGLDLVSSLSTELSNVKKTASMDLDVLVTSVSNLSSGMGQLRQLVEVELLVSDDNSRRFMITMKSFLKHARKTIEELKHDEDQVLLHVREITEYYHGQVSKDEANPLRIFVIVRDFLGMLDRVCKEVRSLKAHSVPFH